MDSGDDLTGAVLDGRYRVLERLAEGAMGVVYRAERVKLGRIVAVKLLHESLPSELASRKRFEIEAKAMARLEHPHCAAVLDFGLHDGKPFVVMDFVSGETLKEVLASGAMSVARVLEIMRQVLSGLAHAHELGIIHRDIKPANIVLSQKIGLGDHVKILDFGLARFGDSPNHLTVGLVVGTPSYMAPEQCNGGTIDARTDLYACGVMLFELLTGRKPFVSLADDPIEIVRMHLLKPPPRLVDVAPELDDPALEAVVARVLAKSPADRYASAAALAAALEAVRTRAPIALPAIPTSPVAAPARAGASAAPIVAASSASGGTGSVVATPGSGPVAVTPGSGPVVATPGFTSPTASASNPPWTASDARSNGVALEVAPASGPSGSVAREAGASSGPPEAVAASTGLAPPAAELIAPGPRPVLPLARRALALRLGLIGGGGFAVILLIAVAAHRTPAAVPIDAAPVVTRAPDAAVAQVVEDPAMEAVARATALLTAGKREAALELLNSSRVVFPRNAEMPYLAGRIYFAKLWFADGLRSFRDAIRLEPSYRADPELIKTVLRGFLITPSYDPEIAGFLRDQVGPPAAALLEETARDHPNAATRVRAAAELRRYR